MNLQSLGQAVDLTAVAAQNNVDLGSVTPYANGFTAVAVITQLAGAGAGLVAKIQTSADGGAWTDVLTMTGAGPTKMAQVTLQRYARFNVTGAGSAGTANSYILI